MVVAVILVTVVVSVVVVMVELIAPGPSNTDLFSLVA